MHNFCPSRHLYHSNVTVLNGQKRKIKQLILSPPFQHSCGWPPCGHQAQDDPALILLGHFGSLYFTYFEVVSCPAQVTHTSTPTCKNQTDTNLALYFTLTCQHPCVSSKQHNLCHQVMLYQQSPIIRVDSGYKKTQTYGIIAYIELL